MPVSFGVTLVLAGMSISSSHLMNRTRGFTRSDRGRHSDVSFDTINFWKEKP